MPSHKLFRIGEWYGCAPNDDNTGIRLNSIDIGKGIKEREAILKERLGIKWINPGPADSSIFDKTDDESIASKVFAGYGTEIFIPANKASGTRQRGLELLRTHLEASLQKPMEHPGLFIFDTCRDWIRTVPVLPRSEKDPEDIDTEAEDHAYDETRYRLIHERSIAYSVEFRI